MVYFFQVKRRCGGGVGEGVGDVREQVYRYLDHFYRLALDSGFYDAALFSCFVFFSTKT